MNRGLQHVFVGNLGREVQLLDVQDLFVDYRGQFDNISMKNGYAFIYFYKREDAEHAMKHMNKRRLFGRPINLEVGDRMFGSSKNEGRGRYDDRRAPPRRDTYNWLIF